jgi:hypothetical protein
MSGLPRALLDIFRSCFRLPPPSAAKNPDPSSAAKAKEDFIKRLFAVTLSVGVASQIVRIMFDPSHFPGQSAQYDWSPVLHEWRTILLLGISLTIVVSSWEGYLGAIERMPLEDELRFWIDIALVFSYLLLTLSSQIYGLWFSIHTVIFVEYLAWDIARSNLAVYKERQKASPQRQHQLSMVITIVWLLYFVIVLLLKNYTPYFEGPLGFTAIALAALAGVLLYRRDKTYRWCWPCKLGAVLAPLIVLAVVACLKVN